MPESRAKLIGVGLYTRADAARLLDLSPPRVSRWAKGDTYWLTYSPSPMRRRQPPVVKSRLSKLRGGYWLSFLDLMELRVIKALVDQHDLSLQHVRKIGTLASRIFDTPYPFASRRIFTEGDRVFASLTRDADLSEMVELADVKHRQLIAGELFDQYLSAVEFEKKSMLAIRWWPRGRNVPIVLDPRVAFGAPVVEGTGTRTNVIAALARTEKQETAADAFELPYPAVNAAVEFEAQLAAA